MRAPVKAGGSWGENNSAEDTAAVVHELAMLPHNNDK